MKQQPQSEIFDAIDLDFVLSWCPQISMIKYFQVKL
jgi:hypothetical protein